MIRSLAQFHEHEKLIAAAQTSAGQFAILVCGIALLLWHDTTVLMPCSFTLVLFFPNRRRLLLAIAAVGMIFEQVLVRQNIELNLAFPSLESIGSLTSLWLFIQVAVATVCLYLVFFAASRFELFPKIIRQFPVITLHILIWLSMALSALPPLNILAFTSVIAWRLSYLVAYANRGGAKGTTFKDHLFYLVPVFEGMSPPYGKGLDYLTRHEATDHGSIVRSQLAGIKLLVLAIIWTAVLKLMDVAIYGQANNFFVAWPDGWTLGVSRLVTAMRIDTNLSISASWAGIYLELIRQTLSLAAIGHVIVGCIRLLGFNVFRNTYKPLLAGSIIEFWNRYNFYFKEVLVEFFFYPTYLRSSWAGPKLRLFLAVFAAAFLGNMYYHLLLSPMLVVNLDVVALWANWGTRLIYCFLLASGIWVSMLRQQKQRAISSQASRLTILRRIAGVWTFYAIIRVWSIRAPEIGFSDRFEFTASLFGL